MCNKPREDSARSDAQNPSTVNNACSISSESDSSTVSNVCVSHCLKSNSNLDSILTTVSCTLPNGNRIRALRDSGSMNNFIVKSLLTNLKYKILRTNINLTIEGFNKTSNYKSSLIELEVFFGRESRSEKIEFLTINDLKISMHLPHLSKIIATFQKNGYDLADRDLSASSDYISRKVLFWGRAP